MEGKHEAGFSMLEMVIIVLIIGVIAAIAIPNAITAQRSYVLSIAADALAQQLNRCRQEAVRANLPVGIQVTSSTCRIDTDRNNTFDSADNNLTTFENGAMITSLTPTSGVVTFSSRGELPIGVVASFTMTYSGKSRVVTVDPRGAVQVGGEIDVN